MRITEAGMKNGAEGEKIKKKKTVMYVVCCVSVKE